MSTDFLNGNICQRKGPGMLQCMECMFLPVGRYLYSFDELLWQMALSQRCACSH